MFTKLAQKISKKRNRRASAPDTLAAINAMLLEIREADQVANAVRVARLLTIADIWSLKLLGRPLHNDVSISIDGRPVSLKVHTALRSHGTDQIDTLVPHPALAWIDHPAIEDVDALRIIHEVVRSYAHLSTYALSKMLARELPAHDDLAPISDDTLAGMIQPVAA